MIVNDMQISANTYDALLSMHNLALLSDWLIETKELFVDVDLPHSGGSHKLYIVKSLGELRQALAGQTWPEVHVAVFRDRQYPIRGTVDEAFIKRALEALVDGQSYTIVKFRGYPVECDWLDDGKTHPELERQLRNLAGEYVGIGREPFDAVDLRSQDAHTRVFSMHVAKNQNYYEAFAKRPEEYTHIAQEWTGS